MEYLARHVVDLWMWTLRQRHNTPCVPLIITFRCNNEGTGDIPHCSGVGARVAAARQTQICDLLASGCFSGCPPFLAVLTQCSIAVW